MFDITATLLITSLLVTTVIILRDMYNDYTI